MKNNIKITGILLLLLVTFQMGAQNSSFDFTTTSSSGSFGGNTISVSSTMYRTGSTFTWNQVRDGASYTTSFTINTASGNWNQVSSQGALDLNMTCDGVPVNLILNGNATGITMTLVFKINASEEDVYILPINTISYQ